VPAPPLVLYLHSSAGGYGADRQLALIAGGLRRHRAAVVLPERGRLAGALEQAGVEVHTRALAVVRSGLLHPRGLAQTGLAAAADARELARLARSLGASLIHSNTSVILGGAPAARIARLPHVWHVREIYAGWARIWPAWRRALLAGAGALPCVSEATRAQFGDAPRARVCYDGLARIPARAERARARAALALPADAFVCATLGRISPWKGQSVLARALARPALAQLGAIGVIAGEAWPGEQHRELALTGLARELGLGDRLRLIGFHDDVSSVLGAADVVVVPSTRPDPLPGAALEAAAAGCCVVAANHGGLPEILRDGSTGRLVAPGDPDALATALSFLASHPEEILRLGAGAARDVRARFGADALLERVEGIYDELLGGPAR
jgi:glycosyltransferase involved in cell wall biosynthesis